MQDWQQMLYGKPSTKSTQTVVSGPSTVDTANEIMEPEPVITYDYDAEMKEIKKKARRTVSYLSKLILPKDMLEEDYVKDKIEQDIQTLAELYWTRRSNELMKLSAMDSIAKGNTAPRMYDVYKDITSQINENNKQLLATEDNLRKTYLELKYEIQRKRVEEASEHQPKQQNVVQQENKEDRIAVEAFTGTKSIIEVMKERQRVAARKTIEFEP